MNDVEREIWNLIREANKKWMASHVHFEEDQVPYAFGWTQLLRDAGLTHISARTFVHEFISPFSEAQVAHLLAGLTEWVEAEARAEYLPEADRLALARLIDPNDSEYVFDRPDLHFMEGVTIYVGRVPGS